MGADTPLQQRATARLRIRQGAPSTSSARVGYIEVGDIFAPEAIVEGEDVLGNASWFALAGSRFVWSGASAAVEHPGLVEQPATMKVHRRPNGSIKVLSPAEREKVFGTFDHTPSSQAGAVKVDPAWTRKNIVQIDTPILAHTGYRKISVHTKAALPFQRVFEKVAAAGLQNRIKTCAGTWVARHMGWNPARPLSSHSWGVAIDLNTQWNGYGVAPAPLGATGSVRELVPIFESEGFAWGGYFEPQKWSDGMHFELSRLDL